MNKVIVSAPGKLVLMGEHSVVYGSSCLVAGVNKRIKVEMETSQSDQWENGKFSSATINNFRSQFKINQPLKVTVTFDFKSNYGLGSSSAITVAMAQGLYKLLLHKEPDQKELFDFCYATVLGVQGVASGFDVAAAIYGGIIYFVTGGKTIEPLPVNDLPLLVAYSGVKADTVTVVNLVKEKMVDHKNGVDEIFKNISNLVEEGKIALLEKDWERLGILWNFNQDYLEDLGVSTEKLDDMILASRKAGAYGAKLSGAGGGDCMIVLVSEEKREAVKNTIEKVGGEVLNIKINSEGVKLE